MGIDSRSSRTDRDDNGLEELHRQLLQASEVDRYRDRPNHSSMGAPIFGEANWPHRTRRSTTSSDRNRVEAGSFRSCGFTENHSGLALAVLLCRSNTSLLSSTTSTKSSSALCVW